MKPESINEWQWERFLLGELPEEERHRIETALRDDPDLQANLTRLRQSNSEILRSAPPDEYITRIMTGVQQRIAHEAGNHRRRSRFPRMILLPIAAAILAIIGWVWIRPHAPGSRIQTGTNPAGGLRVKGEVVAVVSAPALHIYRKRPSGAEELGNGTRARERDLLQLAYAAGDSSHGMIFSIDGKGAITLHFPESPTDSTRLRKPKLTFLEKSYELDNAPGFERFFFIHASHEIDIAATLKKAGDLAADPNKARTLAIPFPGRQQSLLILKGE